MLAERFVVVCEVVWLLAYLTTMAIPAWRRVVRQRDQLRLLPRWRFFTFMPRSALRVEYRSRATTGGWGAWLELPLRSDRRAWHALLHPWIQEPMINALAARKLAALARSHPTESPGFTPGAEDFYTCVLLRGVRRRLPKAEEIEMRLSQADEPMLTRRELLSTTRE